MTVVRLPRGIRTRLFTVSVGSLAVGLALAIAAFNLALDQRLTADANSLAQTRAAAALLSLSFRHGLVSVAETPDAGSVGLPVWVFSQTTPLETPAGPAMVDRAARQMAVARPGTQDVPGYATRLRSLPIVSTGRRVGTVVAAVSLAPYDDTRRTALVGSIGLGVALLAGVALSTGWILRRALKPVASMTADAADWSEHNLDRRFSMGEPHDEITQLAATLDALLGRLGAALRREQRLTTEISHELRTPLARIVAETDLALRRTRTPDAYRDALERTAENARRMTGIVETLMDAARGRAGDRRGSCDLGEIAAGIAEARARASDAGPVRVVVEQPPRRVAAGIDATLAERILEPLVENACAHARSTVSVAVAAASGRAEIVITDDGPGVPSGEAEQIFHPGARGPGAGGDGAGLGLALSRRLARSEGGDVRAIPDPAGGRFVVTLPGG